MLKNTYLAKLYEDEIYKPQTVDDAANLCTKIVPMFEKAGIRVIRLELKKNMIAGAFHDSFGEIVKSRYMLNKILKYPPADYEIVVNSKSVSQLKGQQKRKHILSVYCGKTSAEEGYFIIVILFSKCRFHSSSYIVCARLSLLSRNGILVTK